MSLTGLTISAGEGRDYRGATPYDVQIAHSMIGAVQAGYVSLHVMSRDAQAATKAAPIAITAISRAANLVTVTAAAHGLAIGDVAVIRGEGAAAAPMNGEFLVSAVGGVNEFSFVQGGGNEAGSACELYTISCVAYNLEGYDIPTANRAAGYHCRLGNVNALLWVQCNITNGTHTVRCVSAKAGTGPGRVSSLAPGTGATDLGKAEDAAHTSGDVGVEVLAVRKDTAAALAGTDGDYAPLEVDASGRLHTAPYTTAAPAAVQGPAADGIAVSGNPVRIAGKDAGGLTQDVATATDGRVLADTTLQVADTDVSTANPVPVAGTAADGAAVAGNPVRIAGKDGGGLTQDVATDTAGRVLADVTLQVADTDVAVGNPVPVAGTAADGAAVAGNPVRIAGKDGGGLTQDVATATDGRVLADATLQVADADASLTNPVPTRDAPFTTPASGEIQGAAAATQLPSIACRWANIKACISNVGNVYIGVAGVTKPDGTTDVTTGFELLPGDETGWMPVDNLNRFYRICDNAGDDVVYLCLSA